jgi:hypothetical protein
VNVENRDIVCEKFHHQFIEAHFMTFPHRRQFIHLAVGAAALPATSRFAIAKLIRANRSASSSRKLLVVQLLKAASGLRL